MLDKLSQNNEEHRSEALEKIKDFSTVSLGYTMAANKHSNLATLAALLDSGTNS